MIKHRIYILISVLLATFIIISVYAGIIKNPKGDITVEKEIMKEDTIGEINYIKIKGCPEESYTDDGVKRNPNYFMCRSYLTDGEFVYYHGLRMIFSPKTIPIVQIQSPLMQIQPLLEGFIASSSPDTKNRELMASTIIEGVDLETFEIIYFDDTVPAVQQNNTFSFARDKNHLYLEGKRFKGIDPDTFAILGRGFVKDKDSIYFKWRKLEGSDPDTFEFLWSGFARDKNFVYRNNPDVEIFEGIDPATFERIDNSYLKDKNAIYYKQKKIEGSDPATFEFLSGYTGKDIGNAYTKDKNSVYYLGKRIDSADPNTFEFLPNGWSKDKNAVYKYGNIRVKGIDQETVELLSYGYIKDKNDVYYSNGEKKIEGADPETFEVLLGGYIKDKNSVWFGSSGYGHGTAFDPIKIKNASTSSFEVIDRQYARDNLAVYCSGDILEGFDWGSVVMLQNNYIKDKNFVFMRCDKIDDADAKSFVVLDYSYSKDKTYVYYLGKKIEDMDTDSFENLMCRYSKDKDYIYKSEGQSISKIVNFDAGTFRIIGNCNPADKNGVYTNSGEKIEGADPKTFKFLGGSYSKDVKYVYWGATLIEGVDIATFKFNGGNFARDKNIQYYKGEEYNDELRANLQESEIIVNPTMPFLPPPVNMYNIVPSPIGL